MNTGLQGKNIMVIESVRNFGKPTALAFAREGANLLLVSNGPKDALEETAQAAAELGVKVATGTCDAGDESQVRALSKLVSDAFGHVDVLVNNGLVPQTPQSLLDISFDSWKRKIQTEVRGALFICQEVLPKMAERKWGRVINYGGLAAFQGEDAISATSELAMVGLTRGIAREYGPHNITANCICAGGFEEPGGIPFPPGERQAVPRWGTPEEAASMAIYLASEDSGYLTGQCLMVNGGKHYL